jgi:hypothetical protein
VKKLLSKLKKDKAIKNNRYKYMYGFIVVFAFTGVLAIVSTFAASGPLISANKFPIGFKGESEIITFNSNNRYAANPSAFRIQCNYSHMSYDDPIVYPGQDDAAHLHMFFGNRTTNENSTPQSLEDPSAESTCDGGGINKSSYWAPALIHNGDTPIEPKKLLVYYKPHPSIYDKQHQENIQPVPDNLKLIAGDAKNKTGQTPSTVSWSCNGNDVGWNKPQVIPTNCGPGDELGLSIIFPSCWNGKDLDSPNHRTHLRYFGTGLDPRPEGTVGGYGDVCRDEPGFTTAIPEITMIMKWDLPAGVNGQTIRLSSDAPDAVAGASAHADFMEGWNREAMNTFIVSCIRASQSCTNELGDNTYLTPASNVREAVDPTTNPNPDPTPDTTAPDVTVSEPVEGQSYELSETVVVGALASDNVGIARLDLYVDGELVETRNNVDNFSRQIAAADLGVGNHAATAIVFDTSGNMDTATTVNFTVYEAAPEPVCEDSTANNVGEPLPCLYDDPNPQDTQSPTVSISSPTNNVTVSGTINIDADATDDVGVVRVSYFLDGSSTAFSNDSTAPYSSSWVSTTVANGTHTIRAVAIDAAGNTATSDPITVNVQNVTPDTTNPTTQITAPANNATVYGTITINSSASDNVGVTKVDLIIDGFTAATDLTSPYSFQLDTAILSEGNHTITTRAYDAASNIQVSTPVTINVDNIPPEPVLCEDTTANNAGQPLPCTYDAPPPNSAPVTPGDVTGDGKVDRTDLRQLIINYGRNVTTNTNGDVNGDGKVDRADLRILIINYGK